MKVIIVHQTETAMSTRQFKDNCLKIAKVISEKIQAAPGFTQIISSGSRQTQPQVEALFYGLCLDSYQVWPDLNPYPKAFEPEQKFDIDIKIGKIISDSKLQNIDNLVVILDTDQKNIAQMFVDHISPETSKPGIVDIISNQIIELDTDNEGISIINPLS